MVDIYNYNSDMLHSLNQNFISKGKQLVNAFTALASKEISGPVVQ